MSLFTPEFGLVFWMLVVFLILFGILAKYAWPAIVRMMDERADFIDKGPFDFAYSPHSGCCL